MALGTAGKQAPNAIELPGQSPRKVKDTMVKQFTKPQEAREIEARMRAKRLGVRVAVVSEARSYVSASQSQPGTVHQIERTPAGWVCSCEGYLHTGVCKHLGAVERRAEREGWDFAAVAPLHRAMKYFPLTDPTPLPAVIPFVPRTSRAQLDAELYG